MSRLFYHVMQDGYGNLLLDVTGTMRIAGSGTLATLYGDEAMTVTVPNPMTNHAVFGSFRCYLPNGDYDFYMAKAGYTFEPLTGVQGLGTMAHQDAISVAITGGSASLGALGVGVAAPVVSGDVYIGNHLGIGTAPDATVSLRAQFGATVLGPSYLERLGVGTTAPDGAADAHIGSHLGVGAPVDPTVSLKVGAGATVIGPSFLDRLGVGIAAPASTGDAQVGNRLGVGAVVDPTVSIKAGAGLTALGATFLDRLGVGAAAPPLGGDVYIGNHLGIGTTPDATVSLRAQFGATVIGPTSLDRLGIGAAAPGGVGDAQVGNRLGVGTPVDPTVSLKVGAGATVLGASFLDRLGVGIAAPATLGNAQVGNLLGVGIAPDPTASLTVGAGAILNGLVQANGDVQVADQMAIGGTVQPGISLYNGNAAPSHFVGSIGVRAAPSATTAVVVAYEHDLRAGMSFHPTDTDVGAQPCIQFLNLAFGGVGSIGTSATTTTYNTTSDARLKRDVDELTGELGVIQALRPVSFRWRADDTPGVGFLAQDVADVVSGVVTGEADAVDEEGRIKPQMIDHSKLVVWLVGACKTLAAQNEALQARLALLEDAVGV